MAASETVLPEGSRGTRRGGEPRGRAGLNYNRRRQTETAARERTGHITARTRPQSYEDGTSAAQDTDEEERRNGGQR